MSTLAEVEKLLQAPTPTKSIRYLPKDVRVADETAVEGKALAIPHVDARFTQQRLDAAVGPFGWQMKVENVGGAVIVSIGIRHPETGEWIWKSDTGQGAGGADLRVQGRGRNREALEETGDYKGLVSGGQKRAGYQWGIGRDVYDKPVRRIQCRVRRNSDGKASFDGWLERPESQPDEARGMVLGLLIGKGATPQQAEARVLAWEHEHGEAADSLRRLWKEVKDAPGG